MTKIFQTNDSKRLIREGFEITKVHRKSSNLKTLERIEKIKMRNKKNENTQSGARFR